MRKERVSSVKRLQIRVTVQEISLKKEVGSGSRNIQGASASWEHDGFFTLEEQSTKKLVARGY